MPTHYAGSDPAVTEFNRCVDAMLKGMLGLAGVTKSTSMHGDNEWEFTFSQHMRQPTSVISQELVRIRDAILAGNAMISATDYNVMIGKNQDTTFRILEFAHTRQRHGIVQGLGLPSTARGWDITEIPIKQVHEETAIEPFIGYRDFLLLSKDDIYEPSLISRNELLWTPYEPMIATCNGNVFAPHDAPHLDCTCGIYAFGNPNHPYLRSDAKIWGEVYLWGEVLVCPHGYRAQYAYPKTLFVKDVGTELIKTFARNLEKTYGVPVHLVDMRTGMTAGEIMEKAINKLLEGGENAG